MNTDLTAVDYAREFIYTADDLEKQTKAQIMQHFKRICYERVYLNRLKKDELIQELLKEIKYMIYNENRAIKMREEKEAVESVHRITRVVELRQQTVDLDPEVMEYPYSYIRNGDYDVTPDDIPGEPQEDVGDFPNNIEYYYWIHGGANDEEPWKTLCRLTNGVYVFYKGECDYTGFDCQGSMELYASKTPATLINMAMTIRDYEDYFRDTSA